jgi:hypothetical protein
LNLTRNFWVSGSYSTPEKRSELICLQATRHLRDLHARVSLLTAFRRAAEHGAMTHAHMATFADDSVAAITQALIGVTTQAR